ncbi:hypothetical protein [Geobacillus subterraneus]|uniref:hypothetical protein n=1 Tax=Geobacillus subterraneus TaxID=129338 RepID=UPI001551F7B0|nr:hypothetical protein [Geobacillus subterraneus]
MLFSLMLFFPTNVAFAADPQAGVRFSTEGIDSGVYSSQPGRMTEKEQQSISSGGIPKTTIDQATQWANRKGSDVVSFLQSAAKPFAVIFFILSGVMAVFGVFGNGSLLSKALVGAGIVAAAYAGILYAEPLLSWFVGWLTS